MGFVLKNDIAATLWIDTCFLLSLALCECRRICKANLNEFVFSMPLHEVLLNPVGANFI